jgi:choline-glycine betaine transporter
MGAEMKRLAVLLTAASVILLVLAPVALAHDGGEGWYGPADDKVVTNTGFILIAFFPLFIFVMSMIQWRLDKRKERRKQAHKALAGDEQAWRGGW